MGDKTRAKIWPTKELRLRCDRCGREFFCAAPFSDCELFELEAEFKATHRQCKAREEAVTP